MKCLYILLLCNFVNSNPQKMKKFAVIVVPVIFLIYILSSKKPNNKNESNSYDKNNHENRRENENITKINMEYKPLIVLILLFITLFLINFSFDEKEISQKISSKNPLGIPGENPQKNINGEKHINGSTSPRYFQLYPTPGESPEENHQESPLEKISEEKEMEIIPLLWDVYEQLSKFFYYVFVNIIWNIILFIISFVKDYILPGIIYIYSAIWPYLVMGFQYISPIFIEYWNIYYTEIIIGVLFVAGVFLVLWIVKKKLAVDTLNKEKELKHNNAIVAKENIISQKELEIGSKQQALDEEIAQNHKLKESLEELNKRNMGLQNEKANLQNELNSTNLQLNIYKFIISTPKAIEEMQIVMHNKQEVVSEINNILHQKEKSAIKIEKSPAKHEKSPAKHEEININDINGKENHPKEHNHISENEEENHQEVDNLELKQKIIDMYQFLQSTINLKTINLKTIKEIINHHDDLTNIFNIVIYGDGSEFLSFLQEESQLYKLIEEVNTKLEEYLQNIKSQLIDQIILSRKDEQSQDTSAIMEVCKHLKSQKVLSKEIRGQLLYVSFLQCAHQNVLSGKSFQLDDLKSFYTHKQYLIDYYKTLDEKVQNKIKIDNKLQWLR